MLSADQLLYVVVALVLGGIAAAANYADWNRNERARQAVLVATILINLAVVALYGVQQIIAAYGGASDDIVPPEKPAAWAALAGSLLLAGVASALLFRPVREWVARLFPAYQDKAKQQPEDMESTELPDNFGVDENFLTPQDGTPLFPQMLNYYTTESILVPRAPVYPVEQVPVQHASMFSPGDDYVLRGFNPASYVHLVALFFCLHLLGTQFIGFLVGGLESIAESYEEEGIAAGDLLANAFLLVFVAVVGVGFGIRRNGRQTLRRLGLGMPSLGGIVSAVLLTIALIIFVAAASMVWMTMVSDETREDQTQASEALADSVNTLGLAFLLAATAAVGEEIAFRGALQPVFGFWPTAIIFALTHAQYTLTPAWLIIFGVAVGFGWIRQRYNTTVAILTHFLYNFALLSIALSVPEETGETILRLFS